jgi:hypothetical protein
MNGVTLEVRIGRLVIDARLGDGMTSDGLADAVRSALAAEHGEPGAGPSRRIRGTDAVGRAIATALSERIGPVVAGAGRGAGNGVR